MKKNLKDLECLNVEDVARIHSTTLDVLEDIGIRVESAFGRQLLLDSGCRELSNNYISMPSYLVEECISKNKLFSVYGREPEKTMKFGNGEVFIHNFGSVVTMVDSKTGVQKPTTTQEAIDAFRILDKLDCVHLVGPLVTPTEVDVRLGQILSVALGLQNSTKPAYFTMINGTDAAATIQLLTACAGGAAQLKAAPIAILYASAVSPLYFNNDCISVIKIAAENFVPLASLSCPTMGLTAPMSMAGAMVLHNVETLAFNVIAKLVNPEEQVVYGARVGFTDMRSALRVSGYPEEGLMGAAFVQLARKYNMVSDVYGLATKSLNAYDIQQGYEKSICGLFPILAGADMTSGVGHMGDGGTTSFETLVLDNEICSMMIKAAKGISTTDEESLAFDSIKEVVDSGGMFISNKHTVKYLRNGELWNSGLAKGVSMRQQGKQNEPGVVDHVQAVVRQILDAEDDITALQAVDETLEKIVTDMGISMDGVRTK